MSHSPHGSDSPDYRPASPNYSPASPGGADREQERKNVWEERQRQIPRLPNPRPRALTPDFAFGSDSDSQASKALYQKSCSWFKVPPNIRRDILRLAFGDSRLHMCLDYSHPDSARHQSPDNHCGIANQLSKAFYGLTERLVDESQPANWQWWGSVCHRLPSCPSQPMTSDGLPGPWADSCRRGDANYCREWRGKGNPSLCFIGVMGWLLSCRQNYVETIDILYSTNTLVMDGEHMIVNLPQLILPQRLRQITSLEITWPLESCFFADVTDYNNHEESRLKMILDLLIPPHFLALRRLYVFIEESRNANFIITQRTGYLEAMLKHLDTFAKHMSHLHECAFAVGRNHFKRIYSRATTVSASYDWYDRLSSYRQVWRTTSGEMAVVQLPYVDSYPDAPYHLVRGEVEPTGYWILDGTEKALFESPPQYWCFLSPVPYTEGGSPDSPLQL